MKKFNFRFERILKLRERQEDLLKQELSALVAKKNTYLSKVEDLKNSLEQVFENWRQHHKFNPQEKEFQDNFALAIKNDIYRNNLIVKEYDIKIRKKREELLINRKKLKTLLKLQEKAQERYWYEVSLEERKEMDEIASNQK